MGRIDKAFEKIKKEEKEKIIKVIKIIFDSIEKIIKETTYYK